LDQGNPIDYVGDAEQDPIAFSASEYEMGNPRRNQDARPEQGPLDSGYSTMERHTTETIQREDREIGAELRGERATEET